MADWFELEDALSDAVDDQFGESWRHIPMRARPNLTPVVDTDRAESTIVGVFSDKSGAALSSVSKRVTTSGGPGISANTPRCSIDQRRLGGANPKRADRMRRIRTGVTYEISDVQPDGQGRVVCMFKMVGDS